MGIMKTATLWYIISSCLLILPFMADSQNATQKITEEKIRGNGNIVSRRFESGPFTQLSVLVPFNLNIQQGGEDSVLVETDGNIADLLRIDNTGGKLVIQWKQSRQSVEVTTATIYITAKNLSNIEISGVSTVSCQRFTSPSLTLRFTGVVNGEMCLDCKLLSLETSGTGKIVFRGKTEELFVRNSGVNILDAYALVAGKAVIINSGIGSIMVNATNQLDIDCSGMGNVYYKGSATLKTVKNNGLGEVIRELK